MPLPLSDLTIFDIDHDGRQDIIASYSYSVGADPYLGLRQFRGGSNGTFTPSSGGSIQASQISPPASATADFDGNGRLDLLFLATSSGLSTRHSYVVLSGSSAIQSTAFTVRGSGFFVAAADINRDGKLDVVSRVEPNGLGGTTVAYVGISYGKGNGAFDAAVVVEGTQTAVDPGALYAAIIDVTVSDVNVDGKLDVVFKTKSGTKTLYGDGAGNFSPTPP
jgi:hypothetical protein